MNFTKLFQDFTESERAAGAILIIVSIISLVLANSGFGGSYQHFWHLIILGEPIEYWINDGLMSIFFLLIGLEMEREIYIGELSDIRKASLPVVGAIGGMILPVLVYLLVNTASGQKDGVGIPMATDIAFALGVLSIAGKRVPFSFKIFLTALAIIDDLGAIMVIAIFYSKGFSLLNFGIAMGIFAGLLVLNRLKVYVLWIYLVAGCFMWYFMLSSGVHASITGVLLAFAIPFGNGSSKTISYRLQHILHKPVAFIILPVFALANTGIVLNGGSVAQLLSLNALGIMAGLIIGKPLGIVGAVYLSVKTGLCKLPENIRIRHFWGIGILGGIGFTMSIFISLLAFEEHALIDTSKLAILLASFTAGTIGYLVLRSTRFHPQQNSIGEDRHE